MTYTEALNFIKTKESLGIKPGLIRIKNTLARINNPQNDYKIIHVAGTNGKGSVAATIAKALSDNGYNVGLFTSPWVIDYREQIQLNGEMICENDFAAIIEEVKQFDDGCTEFEFLSAVAYQFFKEKRVDYAVIECGMGGFNDCTNVEKENISVITSISLDHTDFLGETIEEIAKEKSGVLRKNCPCFLYNAELSDIFKPNCKELYTINEKSNISLVNEVLKYLSINPVNRLVRLPARLEIIGEVLLDGGHNVSAAKHLLPHLHNEVAVIAMMKDKDVEGYLKLVASECKVVVATSVNTSRSMPAEKLADIAGDYCDNVYIVENPTEAIKIKDLSLVCGSFYLAREARKYLLDNI